MTKPKSVDAASMHPIVHTPGPWDYSEQNGSPGHCFVAQVWDSEGESLAVLDSTIDPAVATANAKLMALAPEMWEAIQGALKIADLWAPSDAPQEDFDESRALYLMLRSFEEIARKVV